MKDSVGGSMNKIIIQMVIIIVLTMVIGAGLWILIKASNDVNDVNVVITQGPYSTVLLGKITDNDGIKFQYESLPNEYWIVESPLGKKTTGIVINKDEIFTGSPYVRFYNKNYKKDVCQFTRIDLRQEEIIMARE